MDPALFQDDLEAKPHWLRTLASRLPATVWPVQPGSPLLLTGMGSSWFAADVAARRLRRAGVWAVADLASVEGSLPPVADLTVVGITASGGSGETLAQLEAHHGVSNTVVLTNTDGVSLPARHTMLMHAGPEAGGVACRSYLHTLVLLLHLEHQLTGGLPELPAQVLHAAEAIEHLLDTRSTWLPPVLDVLDGPQGTWLLAPAERLGSALQGALMVREGQRRFPLVMRLPDKQRTDPDALAATLQRLLPSLAAGTAAGASPGWLQYIRAAQGELTHQVAVADVLFFQADDKYTVVQTAQEKGVYAFGWDSDMSKFGEKAHLAASVISWGVYYNKVVEDVLANQWKNSTIWWGLKEGAIDLGAYNAVVPEDVKTLVETRKGEKVKIFKKIRRQGYRRTRGHRQLESVVRVTALAGAGKSELYARAGEHPGAIMLEEQIVERIGTLLSRVPSRATRFLLAKPCSTSGQRASVGTPR